MVLPDGTLPDLCLTDDDAGGGKSGHLGGPICDACLISAAMLLPAPIDLTGTALPVVLKAEIPRRHEAFRRQIYPPNAAPRAPPVPVLA